MEDVRIALADPHAVARAGLRRLTADVPEIEIVGAAGCGEDALHLVHAEEPDILLLEALITGPSGAAVARALCEPNLSSRVLVLSCCDEAWPAYRMLMHGAHGYLLKTDPPADVFEAVCGIASGEENWFSPRIAPKIKEMDGVVRLLTTREWEAVQLAVRGLDSGAIGEQLCIAPGTAKNHYHRARSKLDLDSRVELITWGHRLGVHRGQPMISSASPA